MSRILDRLYHLHWVTQDVARSAQPYLGFYSAFLAPAPLQEPDQSQGRERRFLLVDDREAGDLGPRDQAFRRETVVAQPALAFGFGGACSTPLLRPSTRSLLKCSGRTGPHRSRGRALSPAVEGARRALSEAEGQLASWPYLHFPKRHQLWLRHFPGYANAQAGGATLGQWARGGYDPQPFRGVACRARAQGQLPVVPGRSDDVNQRSRRGAGRDPVAAPARSR